MEVISAELIIFNHGDVLTYVGLLPHLPVWKLTLASFLPSFPPFSFLLFF